MSMRRNLLHKTISLLLLLVAVITLSLQQLADAIDDEEMALLLHNNPKLFKTPPLIKRSLVDKLTLSVKAGGRRRQQLVMEAMAMKRALFSEGYLDREKYTEVENYAARAGYRVDDVMREFFQNVATPYYRARDALVDNVVDLQAIAAVKAQSARVGAGKVIRACDIFLNSCRAQNINECPEQLRGIHSQLQILRDRLFAFYEKERQAE